MKTKLKSILKLSNNKDTVKWIEVISNNIYYCAQFKECKLVDTTLTINNEEGLKLKFKTKEEARKIAVNLSFFINQSEKSVFSITQGES